MSDERIVDALDDLPDPALEPTAALLRDVLAREADAVRPSPDGLSRIRAAIETERGTSGGVRRLVALPGTGRGARPGRTGAPRRRSWTTALAAAAAVVLLAGAGGLAVQQWQIFQSKQAQNPAQGQDGDVQVALDDKFNVYVVGERTLPDGRADYALYRERRPSVGTTVDRQLTEALTYAVTTRPEDADYQRVFGAAGAVRVKGHWDAEAGEIQVVLSQAMVTVRNASDARARIAVQQIVWTATAVAGRPDAPVRITVDRSPDATMFGRPSFRLGGLFYRSHGVDDPLAPVMLVSEPDNTTLSRGVTTMEVNVGWTAAAGVEWTLTRDGKEIGSDVALPGFLNGKAIPGSRGTASIDVDHTRPGDYVLTVSEPKGAPEPRWTDSKSFVVN